MKEVMKNERKRTFLLITIPILALFICFNTIPLIRGVIYSFTNFKGFGKYNWVGFDNIPVIPWPIIIEFRQESIHVFVQQESLNLGIHCHFRWIIVILIVLHVPACYVFGHPIQNRRQLEIPFFTRDCRLCINIFLKILVCKKEVQNFISRFFVLAFSHYTELKVNTGI